MFRKISRPRFPELLIALFWIFSSVPRIWYIVEEKKWAAAQTDLVLTLLIGFCSDGMILLPLILFFCLIQRRWSDLSIAVQKRAYLAAAIAASLVLAFYMANVEFFRYFGSNITTTHFGFINETDVITSSLTSIFSPSKIAFALIFIPGLFFVLNYVLPSNKTIEAVFMRTDVRLSIAAAALACSIVVWSNDEEDPLKRNLSENTIVSFTRYFFQGDDIHGSAKEPISSFLDIGPLERKTPPSPEWVSPTPDFPLLQATRHHLCSADRLPKDVCAADQDRDGFTLKDDCNDQSNQIHPGAFDKPGNGIDEDCSGMDSDPPNIIFVHWEGARAVNVGSIGYSDPCTPEFDRHAKKGLLFTNAYANGTQTRWSLTSVYNSILPRLSTKWIFKHNPELNLLSFPEILKERGFQTIYLHGGEIAFGNFKPRFIDWFDIMIDRYSPEFKDYRRVGWGLTDEDLFNFSFDYLKNRKNKRPYFVTIATLSLHHPWKVPDPAFITVPHEGAGKVTNLLRYSDHHLGRFLDRVLSDPDFKNTVVIVAADHGMNYYAPHNIGTQSTLWEDLVWVPILLVGNGWNVPPGVNDEIRQLADIGPTILDRLGIEIPNHFIGHSLLRRFPPDRHPRAFFGNANGGVSAGVRDGNFKYFVAFQNHAESLYDMTTDRQEKNNLANQPDYRDICARYFRMIQNVEVENTRLILDNRIWDKSYELKK